jgi:hypothetical protein
MPGSDDVKPAGVKLTYDDFVLFPDDGKRHELINGEHYVTPTPILRHQAIVGRLYLAIGNYLAAKPIGELIELSREAGDVLTTSLLPGLELPLAGIFRD